MAKTFLATDYEVSCIMEGDVGARVTLKDWYRQRFVVEADELLDETVNIEIPFQLPRDQYDESIIPGEFTHIKRDSIVSAILDCLGVDVGADYQFSVMTGKYFCPRIKGGPSRFALYEPKRSRDTILMATWQKDAPSPINSATEEICESDVVQSASFGDRGYGYCSATWLIRSDSLLGKLLVQEAQQKYSERIRAGIDCRKDYEQTHAKVRDGLWHKLATMLYSVVDGQSIPRITFYDRYLHAEWYGGDEYLFYTEVGVKSVDELVGKWCGADMSFSVVKNF